MQNSALWGVSEAKVTVATQWPTKLYVQLLWDEDWGDYRYVGTSWPQELESCSSVSKGLGIAIYDLTNVVKGKLIKLKKEKNNEDAGCRLKQSGADR